MSTELPRSNLGRIGIRRFVNWRTVLVVAMLAFGFFVPLSRMYWDGGYPMAEFRLAMSDQSGVPLAGVRLTVEGWTMPITVFQVVEGDVVEWEGSWPVFELGRTELVSDRAGTLTFRQLMSGIQFGGTRSFYLFRGWVEAGDPIKHVCVLSKDGFETRRIAFSDLAERVYTSWDTAERVAAPGLGLNGEVPVIPVDVEMRRASD